MCACSGLRNGIYHTVCALHIIGLISGGQTEWILLVCDYLDLRWTVIKILI